MSRLPSRPLTVAIIATALLAAGPAGASAGSRSTLTRIHGSALPSLRSSARVASIASGQPVDVTVSLQPRNADELAETAAHHGRPLSVSQLRARFGPSAATRAAVVRYMRAQGFALRSSGLLALTFHGTAASAARAFHVGLSTYRGANGRLFRAPDGAVSLPSDIAPAVAAVTGLDTQLRLHPAVRVPKLGRSASSAGLVPHGAGVCNGAQQAQLFYGGWLPGQLAHAYGHETLISGGSDGHGESIAMVELSNYEKSDITAFQNCFGLSVPVTNHPVAGGTHHTGDAIEDELDIEVASAAAPGLDGIHVYIAPNNLANILPMIDQMVTDMPTTGAHVISDSWGLCEALLPPSFVQAESTEFQLAAAAGMSTYVASGDSGSSGCADSVPGYRAHVVDDPASQPFVTGVGGTVLKTTNIASSTAWKNGGGGISQYWAQPSYQAGNPLRSYDGGAKCGNPDGFCRQVPDIALNASLRYGYIMRCTASRCPAGIPWFPAGGTSAAAPLMAAITADANSQSNGAHRVGFANPLFYSGDAAMFQDITAGTNSIDRTGIYHAAAGYDPATGLGSPKAVQFANDLQSFVAPPILQDETQLTITSPNEDRKIRYGTRLRFSGSLLTQASTPIAHRRVYLELREGGWIYLHSSETNASGVWTIRLSRALRRNLSWRVIFTGTDTEQGLKVPGHRVFVVPHLGSRSAVSSASRGSAFAFRGSSSPNMHGATVRLQTRRSKHAAWHTVGRVKVNRSGRFSRSVSFATAGNAYLRWQYRGGKSHPWMSATSRSRRVIIR